MNKKSAIVNALTVDVEDYFQVSAFEKVVKRNSWSEMECRVEKNTNRILELFDQHSVKATFFMLGWVAERYPKLVETIVNEGHELASHGYNHIRVTTQQPKEFREDIIKTKALLEHISGIEVKGYRAASYSIGEGNLWALDELFDTGHQYSSSIYPIKHDLYGMPNAPRFYFYPRGEDKILEIPVTTVNMFGKKIPCGGGGFFRLYPYFFSKWAMSRVNVKDVQSGVFYFHPWEIDPDQPRPDGASIRTKFRHYLNLQKMEQRILNLIKDFDWDRMDKVFLDKPEI